MPPSTTSDDVPAARNNNLIAESDLSAAQAALRDYFDQKIKAAKVDEQKAADQQQQQQQQQPNQQGSSNSSNSANAAVVRQQLLRDCAQSLSKRLSEIVQPVADEAFHAYLARYKDDLTELPSLGSGDDGGGENSKNDNDKNEPTNITTNQNTTIDDDDLPPPQEEEDEEALIDREALRRCEEMRQQVRAQAAAIGARRAAALDRSVAVAERQLKMLCWKTTTEKDGGGNNQQENNNNNNNNGEMIALEAYKAQMHDMQASLESMRTTLQEVGTAVPPKLSQFQSTLREIERALDRQHRPDRPLSQIEQAIRLRHRHHHHAGEENGGGNATAELEQLEPAQRLANLLCRD